MRACVQRVSEASVSVDDDLISAIDEGLLVLLGVETEDQDRDAIYMADKIAGLRIFNDDAGKMNRSLEEIGGAILVVSQFTLCGDCRKGRRPSFIHAALPDEGERLYEVVVDLFRKKGLEVGTGRFAANMDVRLCNQGPVTMLLDSRKRW